LLIVLLNLIFFPLIFELEITGNLGYSVLPVGMFNMP
jgi:hypothetical protein